MSPRAAYHNLRKSGHYYTAPLSVLVEHLEVVRAEIAVFEAQTTRLAVYLASRKRAVAAKLEASIRHRVAWHVSELEKARASGFGATSDHEPKMRSINYPRERAGSHA